MLSFFIGLIGVLTALLGWFVFKSLTLLVVGTVLYVIETIMEWNSLNPGAKVVDIVIFAIGCIVGCFVKTPFYICGMLAINMYSAITVILGAGTIIRRIRMR